MAVNFYKHGLSSKDAVGVAMVLDSPFLTSGAVGKQVEAQLCDYFEVPNAFLTNSWTNGALAVLLALGVGPGDEVIVPAMTFIATANVVELLGAKVRFVDVRADNLLVDAGLIEAAITEKTKAVFVVHLYGQMCDMQSIGKLKDKYPHISLVEDAAHCFEGRRDGDRPGKYSDAAIFSFYATKNITCGEGGAIVTRSPSLAGKVQKTRLHGMSAGAADRFKEGSYRHWDMDCLGVKANLPDLLASLLPRQIEHAEQLLSTRIRLAGRYRSGFKELPIRLARVDAGAISAEHLFPIHVGGDSRDWLIDELNGRGIQVAVNYRSVTELSYYKNQYAVDESLVPVSVLWGRGTISLPFYPTMTDDEQDEVIAALHQILVK